MADNEMELSSWRRADTAVRHGTNPPQRSTYGGNAESWRADGGCVFSIVALTISLTQFLWCAGEPSARNLTQVIVAPNQHVTRDTTPNVSYTWIVTEATVPHMLRQ
jgi:hypothetical protein